MAPNVLVTSSPDVWAHVNNKAGYKRSDWYYNACRIEHRRDNVFSQTDVAKHDLRRKQMAPGVGCLSFLCPVDDIAPTAIHAFDVVVFDSGLMCISAVLPMHVYMYMCMCVYMEAHRGYTS